MTIQKVWHGAVTRGSHGLKIGAAWLTGATGLTGAAGIDGLRSRHVVAFFVRFMVIFVVLMAPWPGLPRAYAPGYRAAGNLLFGSFGSAGSVDLRPSTRQDPDRDTEFALANWETDAEYVFAGSSLKGYKPTAFVLALILATPIPWRRRWRALLWGMVCITLYVALRTAVFLAAVFTEDNGLAVLTLGPISKGALDYVYWVVVDSFAGWLILPLPIWALVSFRRQDWQTLRKGGRPSPCS